MKQHCRAKKRYAYFIITCLIAINSYGQSSAIKDYLNQAKGHTTIYRGEIEYFYNPYMYKAQPYYISDQFVDADLYYNNRVYKNVRMRYDTYKGNFLILTPQNNSVILDLRKIEKVNIYGKDIIKLTPPQESGLKADFYIHHVDGKNLKIISREKSNSRILPTKIDYTFDKSSRYYAIYNNKYYSFKNKKSFTRLFPQFKKEINKFIKSNQINFSENREQSMTQVGTFCDELLNTEIR